MFSPRSILYTLLIAAAMAGPLFADTVTCTNGDRLTGKVRKVEDGRLTINSDVAGDVTIPLEKISTFETEKPFAIHLADGTVIVSKVAASDPNTISVPDPNEPSKVDILTISTLDPEQLIDPRWQGSFSLGMSSSHGNSNVESARFSVQAARRTKTDRTNVQADYARSVDKDREDDQVTEDWFKSRAKYDWFFQKKDYIYGDARYETDHIADLKYRSIVGSGLGHQFAEGRSLNLSGEAGLASLHESYNDGPSRSDLTAQFGYHLDKPLTQRLHLYNDTAYNPTVRNFSDYVLQSSAELRAMFTERLFANFKVLFDYDSTPASDKTNTDVKYMLGVGSKF
jgi:putative salt-induced outer membrane protein YdiY